ncbi:NDR1/HIN1-like protein 10 [Gastrolobium bilobum]|uniref:NDR1/HIN1-like protein 10 n=1 Tax=Gastrolobium bilobum TaxID=150636 RepID=UPI002AB04904|nr:NDR1/HIN1-like protein 10 [Gastrolobium bilobum]
MADKQTHLNGAYYGPAIPPPAEQHRHGHHHHHHGRSCCCCLLGIFWKLLIAFVVLVGLVILIFFLVVQPRAFKFSVTEAQLTQFDYTNNNNNNLRYNMVLNFTVRNPNKKLSIYYDKVEALAFYEGSRFASSDVITNMNSFRQYKKSTDTMSGVFSGQQLLLLDNDQVSDFNKDKSVGVYDIHVKLYFRIRFRLGDSITRTIKPKVKCDLKVPLSSNTTFTFFETTNCDVDF